MGYPLPSQLGGLGSVVSFPSRDRGVAEGDVSESPKASMGWGLRGLKMHFELELTRLSL